MQGIGSNFGFLVWSGRGSGDYQTVSYCVKNTCIQSMPILPSENFEKLHPLRLNLRVLYQTASYQHADTKLYIIATSII